MKSKIIVIVLSLALFLFSFTAAFANQYEYNDVRVYISNVLKTTVALKTDTVFNNGSSTYFDVVWKSSDNTIYLCMQGGQPISTGQTVTGLSQVSAGNLTVQYIQNTPIGGVSSNGSANLFRVRFTTDANYTPINLSINASSVKLATPVTSFSNNVLSWQPVSNASGYNIQYSESGTGSYTQIVTNTSSTSYTVYESGYYIVQAIGTGSFYNSDWSNKIQCEYDPGSDSSSGGIIGWFQSTINRITSSINTFFNNVSSIVSNMGSIFQGITAFLPEEYGVLVWSIAGLFLMFGLFRLIF